jgi:hypothetical protein
VSSGACEESFIVQTIFIRPEHESERPIAQADGWHREVTAMLYLSSALLIAAFGMLGDQTAAADPSAGSAPRQVAVAFGQPIYESAIEPRPDAMAKKKTELDAAAFARWLLQARAEQLAGHVQKRLMDDYAKRFRLEPTEAEIQPLVRALQESYRDTEEAMRKTREQRHEEIRAKLKAPDLSAADRERLTAELANLENFLTKPLDTSASDHELMSLLVENWKVQRSLYQRYGGRVLITAFGPTAIDAMSKLLQEEEKHGSFKIFDPELRAAFWTAIADQTRAERHVTQGRGADEVFATPPWQAMARHP